MVVCCSLPLDCSVFNQVVFVSFFFLLFQHPKWGSVSCAKLEKALHAAISYIYPLWVVNWFIFPFVHPCFCFCGHDQMSNRGCLEGSRKTQKKCLRRFGHGTMQILTL